MSIAKSVKPLPGFIVIEEIEPETKTASGLELPDSAQEKPQTGKVLAIGDPIVGKFTFEVSGDAFGQDIPCPCAVGDIVVFQKYTGHLIKLEGKEYQIVGFDKLLAIIE